MPSHNAKRPTYLFDAVRELHQERNIHDLIQRLQLSTRRVADHANQAHDRQHFASQQLQ